MIDDKELEDEFQRQDDLLNSKLNGSPSEIHEAYMKLGKNPTEEELMAFRCKMFKSTHKIGELRAADLNRFVMVEGNIKIKTDVFIKVIKTEWGCKSCTNVIDYNGEHLPSTWECKCGAKRFKLMSSKEVDFQKIVLEEYNSKMPKTVVVYLEDKLCEKGLEQTLIPGIKVKIGGILKTDKRNPKDKHKFKYIEAQFAQSIEESFENIEITPEEEIKIKELASKSDLFNTFPESLFPNIKGHSEIKKAIFLQLVGASHIYSEGYLEERGTINLLLCAPPGVGKSMLLKKTIQYLPNSKFTGGKGVSGVGLVACVVPDKELGGYTISAGVIPMCNKGVCVIDEMDKVNKEDLSYLNNVMQDLQVRIDKATIHTVFETDVSLLCAANPKYSVFDYNRPILDQIDFAKDLKDRFDLIFVIPKITSDEQLSKIGKSITNKYKVQEEKPKDDLSFKRKFIAYARRQSQPMMSDAIDDYINKKFLEFLKPSFNIEGGYYSPRLMPNIIRLSIASAKARLSKSIEIEDVNRALELVAYSFKTQGAIDSHGVLDTLIVENVESASKLDLVYMMLDAIRDLEKEETPVSFERIESRAKLLGLTDKGIDEIMYKLKKNGDIYEPKNNCWAVLK